MGFEGVIATDSMTMGTLWKNNAGGGRKLKREMLQNDSYREGELAAKYLLELGHTTFGFVRGVDNNFDSAERLNGFRDVLKKAGITLEEDYILKGEYEREIAYNSVKDFLELAKPLPEAIFAVPGKRKRLY